MITLLLSTLALQGPSATKSIDFSAVWDKTRQTIERSYYGRNKRHDEMERRLKEFGPKASNAKSKEEFRDIVDSMIAEFKDSHFDFLTDEDQGYYLMDALAKKSPTPMPEFGAWFRHTNDGYVVSMVLNGSEAEKAGIMKGDVITTVDGKPFSPVEGIRADDGHKATLHVLRGDKQFDKDVNIASENALDMFLEATSDSARVITSGNHKIGYVHLWTQANERFSQALSAIVYNRFRDTDGCILDLRDGFGGRPEGFGDPFFRPQVMLDWKFNQSTNHELFGYQKPLVVLINGGSRSAKEVLAFVFQKSKRATLIGSNTAGNVLGTFPSRVADWAYVEIPMVEVYADGIRLEDRGVAPDIKVDREFDSSGRDLYLEKALDYLDKKL